MKRHSGSRLIVAAFLLVGASSTLAAAQSPFLGYGRRGAELWVEAPRYTVPLGNAYTGDRYIENGWGFGFGLMFGFTDVIAIEGRVIQSKHEVKSTDVRWDLDHAFVGVRYTFGPEEQWEPFVSVGGARLALETHGELESSDDFERRTGYGAYVGGGFDYIISPRFVLTARADYFIVWYTKVIRGAEEFEINGTNGEGVGVSLCLGYRVPTW